MKLNLILAIAVVIVLILVFIPGSTKSGTKVITPVSDSNTAPGTPTPTTEVTTTPAPSVADKAVATVVKTYFISTDQYLKAGDVNQQSITSQNGMYYLIMQTDGNLVLYKTGGGLPDRPLWASATSVGRSTPSSIRAYLQNDGNFVVVYGTTPMWATGTNGKAGPGSQLRLQDDGNLVLYNTDNIPVWATGTYNM